MSVSLSKNQSVSLKKESGHAVTKVHVGLGWDAAKPTGFLGKLFNSSSDIDLDASCVLLDATGNVIDTVWFRQLKSRCGSIVHSGDNRTGDGDGDDEVILIDLQKVPANVQYLAFTVNSFTGQNFSKVDNASVRILDQANKELAKFNLTDKGSHTGVFIASMSRNEDDWQFKAHGIASQGSTFESLLPTIKQTLLG